MNYQQAHQPPPQPANYRNPNQESPIIKYILIAGAVLLTLLVIATAVIFILSRTYSDEDSKDDATSKTEEETDTDQPPETNIPENALKTRLLDTGIGCNYVDRGLFSHIILSNASEIDTTQTDNFKGPVFLCENIENTDTRYFQLTPGDFRIFQELVLRTVIEEDEGITTATVKEACADPIQAQTLQQSFEERFGSGLGLEIEDWVFLTTDDDPEFDSLKNKLAETGIQTKTTETPNICDVLLNEY